MKPSAFSRAWGMRPSVSMTIVVSLRTQFSTHLRLGAGSDAILWNVTNYVESGPSQHGIPADSLLAVFASLIAPVCSGRQSKREARRAARVQG